MNNILFFIYIAIYAFLFSRLHIIGIFRSLVRLTTSPASSTSPTNRCDKVAAECVSLFILFILLYTVYVFAPISDLHGFWLSFDQWVVGVCLCFLWRERDSRSYISSLCFGIDVMGWTTPAINHKDKQYGFTFVLAHAQCCGPSAHCISSSVYVCMCVPSLLPTRGCNAQLLTPFAPESQ